MLWKFFRIPMAQRKQKSGSRGGAYSLCPVKNYLDLKMEQNGVCLITVSQKVNLSNGNTDIYFLTLVSLTIFSDIFFASIRFSCYV